MKNTINPSIYECLDCRRTMTTLGSGTPKSCPNCHAPQAAIRVYRATPRMHA